MKIEIRHTRFEYQYGRNICFCQLYSGDEKIFGGTLSQTLQYVFDKDLKIDNAQEILDLLVRKNGCAA